MKVNVRCCARCGNDHEELEFSRLTYSSGLFDEDGDGPYSHWAACPYNGEPILLVVVDKKAETLTT